MMAAEKPIEGNDDSERAESQGSDRRRAPRVLVNLVVDFASQANFLFAYIRDISTTGIFVGTDTPEPAGTRLNLRFTAPGTTEVLDVEGEVIWVNPYRPGARDNLNPGMGVRFVGLSAEENAVLLGFVKTFALLGDE
jgi:uncharacterized protein (TIGR02266 family)